MKISLCFCGKNLALVFPTFPSGKQFSAMHGTNGILNFSADTDTVYSFALRNHAWRGKLKKVISVQYYIFAGGYADQHAYDDILEYDIMEDEFHETGNMLQARRYHAVSVVQIQDYSMWCQ